jgi:hypothetical protein
MLPSTTSYSEESAEARVCPLRVAVAVGMVGLRVD